MGAVSANGRMRDHDEFRVELVRLDGVRIVAVHGDCDLASARELRDALTRELEGDDRFNLVVDLSQATVFDSTSLGVVVLALKASRSSGRGLAVVTGKPALRTPFEVAGLDRLVPMFTTRSAAIVALQDD
jgi:anti-anti-sigma factor